MNCPDIETLIRFAECTPDIKDTELASHIYICKDCSTRFCDICEVINCDHIKEPSPLEKIRYEKFFARGIKSQDKVAEIIFWFLKKFEKKDFLSLSFEKIPFINEVSDHVFAAGLNHPRREQPFAPQITFESTKQYTMSQSYWRAVMYLPLIMKVDSEWDIYLYDADDKLIPEAILWFRGIRLEVKAGKAKISVKNFKDRQNDSPEISLSFPGKSSPVPGDILLQ